MAYEQSSFDKQIVTKNKNESVKSPLKFMPQYFGDQYCKEKLIGNRNPIAYQPLKGGFNEYLENNNFKTDFPNQQSHLGDHQQLNVLNQSSSDLRSNQKPYSPYLNQGTHQSNSKYVERNYFDIQHEYIPNKGSYNQFLLNNISSEQNFRKIWGKNINMLQEENNLLRDKGLIHNNTIKGNNSELLNDVIRGQRSPNENIVNYGGNRSQVLSQEAKSLSKPEDNSPKKANNNPLAPQYTNNGSYVPYNNNYSNNLNQNKNYYLEHNSGVNALSKELQESREGDLQYSPSYRQTSMNNYNVSNVLGNSRVKVNDYLSEYSNYRKYENIDNGSDDYLRNKLEGYGRNVISSPDKDYKQYFELKNRNNIDNKYKYLSVKNNVRSTPEYISMNYNYNNYER